MIDIREERPGDVAAIREVNRLAFSQEEEGWIVDDLRTNGGVSLSLVATDDDVVVGHIMFSPLSAGSTQGVALGPMAVAPAYQRRGIGSSLVKAGVERMHRRGCPFIVVIGHPAFYPRFGFQPAAGYGLLCEWRVPAEAFMVKVLDPQLTGSLKGTVRYRAEFATRITVERAIQAAERLLPGEAAPDGETDPRWQAILRVGDFIKSEPDAVWSFIQRWGVNANTDLRTAVATCLLEHLLGAHFGAYFPRVEAAVRGNQLFADTFQRCWRIRQANEAGNSDRFDALLRECEETGA